MLNEINQRNTLYNFTYMWNLNRTKQMNKLNKKNRFIEQRWKQWLPEGKVKNVKGN